MLRLVSIVSASFVILVALAGCSGSDGASGSGSGGSGDASAASSEASKKFAQQFGGSVVKEGTVKETKGCMVLSNWEYDTDEGRMRVSGIFCSDTTGSATLSASLDACTPGEGAAIVGGAFDGSATWKATHAQPGSGSVNGDPEDYQNGFGYGQMQGASSALTVTRSSDFAAHGEEEALFGMLMC